MTLSVAKCYLVLRKYDLWPHFWQYCVIRYREFQYEVIMSATGCPRKRSSKYGVSLVRADSVATLIMTRIIYLTHCWSLDCHQWRGIFQRIFQLHWAVIPANVWSDLTTLVTKNTEQSMQGSYIQDGKSIGTAIFDQTKPLYLTNQNSLYFCINQWTVCS